MKIDYYKQKLHQAKEHKAKFEKQSNTLSTYRLGTFLALIGTLIIYFINTNLLLLILSIILLSVFIILIIIHNGVTNQLMYYQRMILVINEYLARFDERWLFFSDTGEEFRNEELSFLNDLDIIGDSSLFKYINICKTRNAKYKLIERLSNRFFTSDELVAKQETIKEIATNIDFSIDFQIALKKYKEDGGTPNLNEIVKSLKIDVPFNKIHFLVVGLFTIFVFLTLLLAILGRIAWPYFIVVFVLQLLYSSTIKYKYQKVFEVIQDTSLSISSLKSVYDVIDKAKFENKDNQYFQTMIRDYGLDSIKGINKIKDIESYNKFFVTYFILNGLFSLNVFLVYMFKKYTDKFGKNFSKSTEAFEQFEVNVSLAIVGQTKENVILPTPSSKVSIQFNHLQHPLITETDCVPNSFKQEKGINIITGSNMSGKTSFIRTIGINLILMNAGTYVNASNFESPYLKIFTSIRISDDLSKGISTFYAEILRIREAIEYSKFHKPMILFIDEIFKGTNSNDRIQGAISIIEKLNQDNIIIFISTHDFEICDIKSVSVENYHFTEHYEGDKIKFDYLLHKGKCQTTNAQYLMRIAGIID